MKKIIKIIFVGLFVFFIVLIIGILVFLKTFDLNRFKPQIIAAGQSALGRSIDFAKVDLTLSLKNGIQLRVADIRVAEHPDFGKEDFLTAKEINLAVSIKDIILKRQIRIFGIECKAPNVNIIRLKDGRINVQAFGGVRQDKPDTTGTAAQKSSSEGIRPAAIVLPAIFINRVNIEKGRLAYIDYSLSPITFVFNKIALRIDDFSLTRPFPITFRASFASNSQNIFAQGSGQINMNRLSFLLKDVKAASDLTALSMDTLRSLIRQLEGVSLPEIKSGALSVSIDLFEAGPQGVIALKGQGSLTNGSLKMKELIVPIEPIDASFTINESSIMLNDASFSLGKGKAEFSGNISDYLRKQDYSVKAAFNGFDLNESLDQSMYPIKVKGFVFGNIEVKGQGFDPGTILSNLTGNSSIEINEGQIGGINVLKMVLDKLSFVPNLADILETGLPERFKDNLRKKDTAVPSLKLLIEVNNAAVVIRSMNVDAETFRFQGSGTINFDQSYSLNGFFTMPQDLSLKMAAAVPEMEYLMDETRQIRFPLKISGKGAAVYFMPDVKQIGVTAIKQKGIQELEKVLDKVFGKESSSQENSQAVSGNTEQVSPAVSDKKDGRKQLIDSIIGTIFKE